MSKHDASEADAEWEQAFLRQKQRMGTDLLALVISWQMGTTFRTQRDPLKGKEHETDESWGELAWQLQRGLVEAVSLMRRQAELDDDEEESSALDA